MLAPKRVLQSCRSTPAFFCIFEFDLLKSEFLQANVEVISIEQSYNDKGDNCHYNILGFKNSLTDKFSKKYFKNPTLFVCCRGSYIQVSEQEFMALDKYSCN